MSGFKLTITPYHPACHLLSQMLGDACCLLVYGQLQRAEELVLVWACCTRQPQQGATVLGSAGCMCEEQRPDDTGNGRTTDKLQYSMSTPQDSFSNFTMYPRLNMHPSTGVHIMWLVSVRQARHVWFTCGAAGIVTMQCSKLSQLCTAVDIDYCAKCCVHPQQLAC